ncbi:zinc finger protein OZF-like [Malaya genurostris]|uniref:zinc finger protein OZF-like n=1 Tax=Malaya genurostris TaxID=325434 RepID=UPI0026F387D1|nr:zinc finger protein OZF-like [Malaya genurostris]
MDKIMGICRFCLNSTVLTESILINNAEFRSKFEVLFNFAITDDKLLPSIVCSSCRSRIIEFYNFHETVRVNQIELRNEAVSRKEYQRLAFENVIIKQETPDSEQNELDNVIWLEERETNHDADDVEQDDSVTVLKFKVELNEPDTSTDDQEAIAQVRHSVETLKRIDEHELKSQKERIKRSAVENQKISEFFELTCEYCPETSNTFGRLQTHCRNVHDKKAGVKCCGRIFYDKYKIIEHINSHENPNQFYCEICQKSYRSKEYLAVHNLKMHRKLGDNSFSCDECGKSFPQQGLLNAHLKAHTQTICSICHQKLGSNSLKMHMLRHTGTMKYVCDTCGKEFRSKITLEQHIKRHKGIDDRLQCHICGRWILGKRVMQIHMNTVHCDKTREFYCDICFLKYPNERSLSVHKGRVHVEKKFECEFCGKRFKRSINCKEHRASHTGEVLYSCNICDATFNSNGNLYSHKKNKHPEEWMEAKKKAFAANYGQEIKGCP